MAHLFPAAAGAHVAQVGVEPVQTGASVDLGGEDLHGVAVLQGGVQRDQAAVHLGPDAPMPQLGVDLVSEIQGGGTGGKLHDVPLGSVNKYLVAEDVLLHRLDKLGGARHLPLPLQQLAKPGHLLLEPQVTGFTFFVAPVGRHTVLGNLVHLLSLDLHLQGLATLADYGGVEGLVHVLFRVGDVVVELAVDGMPKLVSDSQGFVAILLAIYQHPQGVEIVDVAQLLALGCVLLYLLIDAVDALGTPAHLPLDVKLLHFLA